MRGRWLRPWGLVVSLLGLPALVAAQQPAAALPAALARPVQLSPGRRPLGAVLTELAQQGQLPLSYSSSLVPLGHRFQVRPGPPRPLGEVLREVLASEHLAYGLLDGQLVVWPSRVAPPLGTTYLNGQLPVRSLAAGKAPAGLSVAPAAAQSAGAAGRRPGRQPDAAPGLPSRPGLLPGRVRGTSSLTAPDRNAVIGFPATPPGRHWAESATKPTATRLADNRPTIPTKRVARSPATQAPSAAGRAGDGQLPARRLAAARPAALQPAQPAARQPRGAATAAGLSPGRPQPAVASRELFLLAGRPVALVAAFPPPLPVTLAAGRPPTPRRPVLLPPSALPLRGLYLHAEAWGSESLLPGVTGKLGVPRLYLVLGAALADNGRQSGPAFGLGLGTAGRPRGRFTPNLDLLAWRVGAGRDREEAPILLTQLRPQLSWQVRRGSRLSLVAGPTLNLATARQRGPQLPRWDFGRDQWRWVDRADDESLLRLWPGVQVGVRF